MTIWQWLASVTAIASVAIILASLLREIRERRRINHIWTHACAYGMDGTNVYFGEQAGALIESGHDNVLVGTPEFLEKHAGID